jgi:hypothetical protein
MPDPIKKDTVLVRLRKQHPNSIVTAKYPEKGPSWAKAKETQYSIRSKSGGGSVTVTPVTRSTEKKYTVNEILANKFNNKKKP